LPIQRLLPVELVIADADEGDVKTATGEVCGMPIR